MRVFKPYEVFERGSLRIGVIGIACPIVDKTMPPSFSEGIRFTIGREELPGSIARLRDVGASRPPAARPQSPVTDISIWRQPRHLYPA